MIRRVEIDKNKCVDVNDLIQDYMYELKVNRTKESTYKYYCENLKLFAKFTGSHYNLNVEKPTMVTEFKEYLQNETNRNATSINTTLRAVRAFLNWCFENGIINKKIKVSLLNDRENLNREREIFTFEELRALADIPTTDNYVEWRNWALCCVLMECGCRISTALILRVCDVNFVNGTIKFYNTKSDRVYYNTLTDTLGAYLKEYIRVMGKKNGDLLFTTIYDTQLTVRNTQTSIKKYKCSRGVERSGVHRFRHTVAVLSLLQDVPKNKIAAKLGHTNESTIDWYAKNYLAKVDLKANEHSILNKVC